MRREMDSVPIDGTIVIGEGERDEAPMLYIGERVGAGARMATTAGLSEIDIAVDPLEGTNLCATGAANAIAVLAASERGGLLHAPDIYMEKLVVGPSSRDVVDLDAPVRFNLRAIAQSLGRKVEDLVVIVLDRPRHQCWSRRSAPPAPASVLIGDGDLSAGIAAAVVGSGVHCCDGHGGAPEGVLTAAAMRCLAARSTRGSSSASRSTRSAATRWASPTSSGSTARQDLASGQNILFAATGVTDGTLMKGVRFFGDGVRTTSLVMQTSPHRIRFVDSIHVSKTDGVTQKIRF
jgi:fructose-1,6-bisphosphatase/sedoheptulose 1,7-bisphosphatase-like protein